MGKDFNDYDVDEDVESVDIPPKRKRGDNLTITNHQGSKVTRWMWSKILIPLVVGVMGVVAVIIASGNGQVIVNIVNTIFDEQPNQNDEIIRTQVAIELTQTSIATLGTSPTQPSATQPPILLPTLTATACPPPIVPRGTVIYQEDFEDDKADNWSTGGVPFSIVTETSGNKVWRKASGLGGAFLARSIEWTNYVVQLRYYVADWYTVEVPDIAFAVRVSSPILCQGYEVWMSQFEMALSRKSAPEGATCADNANYLHVFHQDPIIGNTAGKWHSLVIEVNGNRIQTQQDSCKLIEAVDETYRGGGFQVDSDVEVWYDDIIAWEL